MVVNTIMREDGAATLFVCLSRRNLAVMPATLLAVIPSGRAVIALGLVMAMLTVGDFASMFTVRKFAAMLAPDFMSLFAMRFAMRKRTSVLAEVLTSFGK